MASISRVRDGWQVRYRDPERRQRARMFARKADAERFARNVGTDKDRGEYLDPRGGKVTVEACALEWLSIPRGPKHQADLRTDVHRHIIPRLGRRQLASVRPVDVQRFVSDLSESGLSADTVRGVHGTLRQVFKHAVVNGMIARSPVIGIKLPPVRRREMQVLTPEQVTAVASNVPDRYRALVYVLAYGGLRLGEATALKRRRSNLLRGRIEVAEAVTDVGGKHHLGPTKTHERRSVAIPRFLVEMLAAHIERYVAADPDALVFTSPTGGALRAGNFRKRVWWPALEAAGLPRTVRIHDLRHTCASLLIAQGAHAKAVQAHLGHSSIQVTFDVYGHLLPDEQDRIAAALDKTYTSAH